MNEEKHELLKEWVANEWIKRKNDPYSNPYTSYIDNEDENHIINIGCSVLMTKFPELKGYPGGSFVQSIVNNDLEGSFANADMINSLVIKFYVQLIFNFSPILLEKQK